MRVLPISNNNQNNTGYKGASKICKYGVSSLIASSTLFMLSNALEPAKSDLINEKVIGCMKHIASVFGIAGTALSLFGIEQVEQQDKTDKE